MKKPLFLISIAAVTLAAASAVISRAESTNLIANPSVEQVTSTRPTGWTANSWGTNTSKLTYVNSGKTGSKSLKVEQTSRTSGDAKWMHQAVNVTPNKSYTYRSWYKSTVATEITLQYTTNTGQLSYEYVRSVPVASNWTELSADFTTPSNVSKVVVMHLVAQPGTLQTDDFSLSLKAATPVEHDDENLIANGSFETTSNSAPTGWSRNAWGTNTAEFTYQTSGRTGTKSASVRMTSYTDGDAKWYATPVDVTAGKNYIYTDYYTATVPTNVFAAFVNAQGQYSYTQLKSVAAASSWTKYTDTFTVPTGATKVSIYHVIDKVGSLAIDDVNLSIALPTQPSTVSVPNGSLETAASANAPANWQSSKWGTNQAQFSYPSNGRTGTRSVKVDMTQYTDGDAKWYFDPVKMTPGEQYRFTAWYRGTANPHPVALFIMQDGTERYFGMPQPQTAVNASTWQRYSDTFTVPVGAVSGSVFMFVNQVGWLQTDDYSLDTYHPNGFNRALLSMTFDDGHEDNATNALPLLNQYGFKTTQCYATSYIEGKSQTVINGVLAFKNSGHEICSHTVTHPFSTSLSAADLKYELQHSKQYLESLIGKSVPNFATPYGDYNQSVIAEIKKHYASHRSVDEGYNSKDNFNIYNIRVQNVLDTTTASDIAGWIQHAQADRTWLVLVYHRVASNPGPYDTYTSVFSQHLQAIKASGIPVATYQAALDEVKPQL